MGKIKKIELIIKLILWHILNEKSPKPEEIKEGLISMQWQKTLLLVLQLDSRTYFTMLIGMKVNYTTKEKF
jgi:hypothetical protein